MQIRAKHSPIMLCSAKKNVVIVRKRAEWPLPSWTGGMKWRAKVHQKQDTRSRLPLPFMSQMGVTQCSHLASAFFVLCSPPFSLHHFVLFPDQLPHLSSNSRQDSEQDSLRVVLLQKMYVILASLLKKMENYIHLFFFFTILGERG